MLSRRSRQRRTAGSVLASRHRHDRRWKPGRSQTCAPAPCPIPCRAATLQIADQFRGRLIAQLAVFLQRLADDVFQPGWKIGIQAQRRNGRRFSMPSKTVAAVSPANGNVPVAISYSTVPKENRSVRESRSLPFACSGDIYATVPTAVPGLVRNSGCRRWSLRSPR